MRKITKCVCSIRLYPSSASKALPRPRPRPDIGRKAPEALSAPEALESLKSPEN